MADKILPYAVAGAVLAVAGGSLLALSAGGGSTAPSPTPSVPNAEPEPIVWLGGPVRDNVDGLAYMLASENPDQSLLLWALQAIAANNWAKLLRAARHPIHNIGDMLRSGVIKKTRKRSFNLAWGPQFDKSTKMVRWAATTAGTKPTSVDWRFFEFAERMLAGRIDLTELQGRRGERLPQNSVLRRIHSFLQTERFGETVQRQTGSDEPGDLQSVLESWGDPRLLAAVDGVAFYGGR